MRAQARARMNAHACEQRPCSTWINSIRSLVTMVYFKALRWFVANALVSCAKFSQILLCGKLRNISVFSIMSANVDTYCRSACCIGLEADVGQDERGGRIEGRVGGGDIKTLDTRRLTPTAHVTSYA